MRRSIGKYNNVAAAAATTILVLLCARMIASVPFVEGWSALTRAAVRAALFVIVLAPLWSPVTATLGKAPLWQATVSTLIVTCTLASFLPTNRLLPTQLLAVGCAAAAEEFVFRVWLPSSWFAANLLGRDGSCPTATRVFIGTMVAQLSFVVAHLHGGVLPETTVQAGRSLNILAFGVWLSAMYHLTNGMVIVLLHSFVNVALFSGAELPSMALGTTLFWVVAAMLFLLVTVRFRRYADCQPQLTLPWAFRTRSGTGWTRSMSLD